MNNLPDQIILMRLGDLDVVDRTDLGVEVFGHVVDEDVAVDFLGLAFEAALEEEIGFLRQSLEQNSVDVADLGFV